MTTGLPEVIAEASPDDRTILAALLDTRQNDPQSLRDRLRAKSRTLWQKISGNEVPYAELLQRIGEAHGIRPVLLETPEDFERRIVRTFFRRTHRLLASPRYGDSLMEMKKGFQCAPSFGGETVAGASILAAQASGFGVYQMATTVMGMASSAAGITIPFIGYMALTKSIFLAIGPLGWATLGVSILHKLTKPKYSEMVAVVAWMFLVRSQTHPRKVIGGYTVTEIARKLFKLALPIGLISALLIATRHPDLGPSQLTAAPPSAQFPIAQILPGVPDLRAAAVAKALGSNSLHWKAHFAPGENHFVSGGDDLTGKIILDEVIEKIKKGDVHLIVIRSDPGEEGMNSCHACSTLLSAFVFEVVGDKWLLLASNRYLAFGGNLGASPDLSVARIGRRTFALVSRDFSMHQGYESGSIGFYAISPPSIVEVLDYVIPERLLTGDEQKEGDNTTYDIVPSSTDFFDIQISSGPPGAAFHERCQYSGSMYKCTKSSDQ